MEKLLISQAVVVEGRDDVRAVSEACEALIIPTHGFGISRETWNLIEKAYEEKVGKKPEFYVVSIGDGPSRLI